LPLTLEERGVGSGLGKVRRVAFLGETFAGADYLDLLSLPALRAEVTAAIFTHLFQHVSFDLLELEGLVAGSPTLAFLAQHYSRAAKFSYRQAPHYTCPQIALNTDWPTLLGQSRRGNNFKQKLRRIGQRYGYEHRVISEPAEVEAAFERYYKLHETRWLAHGGSDATGHARLRGFQLAAVRRLAEAGLVRFEELWSDGACRASNYGLDDGRNFYFYSAGYDLTWRHLSPGLVLMGLSIESAIGRGLKHFDFLRGDEDYKFDWATSARETVSVKIARRNLGALLLQTRERVEATLRATAKSALPAPVANILRNWVRASRRQQSLAEHRS
jgi:CelD/BcsL family acetyltransferase involved in cellulose biosynthesis